MASPVVEYKISIMTYCTVVTQPAPQFTSKAVINGEIKDISLADYKGKYVVLIFYPLDL